MKFPFVIVSSVLKRRRRCQVVQINLTMAEETTGPADPAEARKRRKAIITSQRQESESNEQQAAAQPAQPSQPSASISTSDNDADADNEDDNNDSSRPSKKRDIDTSEETDKKTQIRYDPEVPMSKEQLAVWRREARRVRNRESAAASRQRIRSRITELEEEIEGWKSKYDQAMARLDQLKEVETSTEADSAKENSTKA
jgi:flagellar basal body rod protein FlgC